MTVRETVSANKQKFGKSDLKKLFGDASRVVVAKGKKYQEFDLKETSPGSAELAKAALGPSGNLRAPAIKTGKTWLIGFHEEPYAERFG